MDSTISGQIQKADPPWGSAIHTRGVITRVQNWRFYFLDPPAVRVPGKVLPVARGDPDIRPALPPVVEADPVPCISTSAAAAAC